MVEFIKKNKKIILSSSIFIGINNLNNNIFGQCSGKCGRDKNNISGSTSIGDTNREDENQSGDKDPKKGNPPQNPPQNPNKSPFQIKKEQLLLKIEDLKKTLS